MTKLAQRMLSVSAAICSFLAYATPMSAQDFGAGMLFGLGKSALSEGKELLDEAPDRLEEFLQSAEQGQTFLSAVECLGALQVGVNAGSIIANILPFSSVETFEDKRGPVAKFRVLLNGNKVHLEAFCDKKTMSAVPLPWGNGNPAPERVTQSSIDAIAGLLLLLQAQGAFSKEAVQTSEAQPLQSTHSWSSAASVAGFASFGKNDIFADGFKIVHFTASSCAACASDHALLADLGDDVPVYGIFFKYHVPNTNEFFSDGLNPYDAIVSDVAGRISMDFEIFGLPETLLIGPQGVVLERHLGPLTATALTEKFLPVLVNFSVANERAAKKSTSFPILDIAQCWNVGSLSTEALTTTIVVGMQMTEEAIPIVSSIRMLSFSGGSDRAAQQAFQSARRAIIRCGASGYDLPEDWIDSHKEVILTFDAERMRIR